MKKGTVAAILMAPGAGGTFTNVRIAQGTPDLSPVANLTDPARQVPIWRDPGCGCCDTYAQYLEARDYALTLVDDPDFDRRSVDVGVPGQGFGCHLAQVDGYYVNGLVPVEIIERLVSERPERDGITLPGMPGNAPGMAQIKSGTPMTYSFGEGGIAVYSNE
ncbi:MAG: metal-binding protein [Paracoccus sp.]|nr:metal-binding protein [Paracoccus sp. (in: a-proteobacteria)]